MRAYAWPPNGNVGFSHIVLGLTDIGGPGNEKVAYICGRSFAAFGGEGLFKLEGDMEWGGCIFPMAQSGPLFGHPRFSGFVFLVGRVLIELLNYKGEGGIESGGRGRNMWVKLRTCCPRVDLPRGSFHSHHSSFSVCKRHQRKLSMAWPPSFGREKFVGICIR